MNPLEHWQVICGFKWWYHKLLQAIVHDRCPSQLASKLLTGGNINVNIFVNIRPIVNSVVAWDCYLT